MKLKANQRAIAVAISTFAITSFPAPAVFAQSGLEEIIVSARKTDEALQQVPIAVTAFTADDLRAMNVVQTSDIGRFTPSVHIEPPAAGNGTVAKVSIRGQQQNDSLIALDPSIGWYLDDVYLARAYGTVASLFDAQRVEVLKGPQGTLYGRNTTGGAIKIVTTKAEPSGDIGGYITGGIGNYDQRKIAGAVNIPLVDNVLGLRLAALKDQRDGYADIELHSAAAPFGVIGNREAGDKDTEMYRANLTWFASDAISVNMGYEHSEVDLSLAIRNSTSVGDGSAAFPPLPISIPKSTGYYNVKLNAVPRSNAEADTLNVSVDWEIADALSSRLIYGWREVDSAYITDTDGTSLPISGFASPGRQKARQESYEWQISGSAMQDRMEWITGLYYFEETGSDETNSNGILSGFATNRIYGKATNTSQSAFFNTTLHLTDQLSFTGGLRYTKDDKPIKKQIQQTSAAGVTTCSLDATAQNFNSANCTSHTSDTFEFISWSAGFDYQLADDVMIYLKGSEASRSGGQNVRGASGAASQPFKPETARDIEAGIKSQFLDNRVRLNADVYHTFYSDIQQTQLISTPTGLTTAVVNAANGDIDGVEMELTALLTDQLTLGISGSLLNWKFDDDNSILSGAPGQQYSVRLDYRVPVSTGELNFNLNYSYRGEYTASASGGRAVIRAFPDATVDSIGLVNARVSFDIPDWGLNVAVWGNNLTDEKYGTGPLILYFPPTLQLSIPIIGEPMTYGIEVTKHF